MRETLDRLGANQWTGFGEIRILPTAFPANGFQSKQFAQSGDESIVRITATRAGLAGQPASSTIIGELEVLRYQPGTLAGSINVL
jgi:hypothetical protein